MISEPRVSVAIPTFNGMPYLAEAIDSIRRQTYPGIDLFVVDGGSTDGTLDWLKDQSIDYVSLPPGTPVAHTWTAATERTRGDLVTLMCQDDLLYPTAIAVQVHNLQQSRGAIASVAQRDVIDAGGHVVKRSRGLAGITAPEIDGSALIRQCFRKGTNVVGEPHVVLFRREALLEHMPWDGTIPYLLDLGTYQAVFDNPGARVAIHREPIGAFRVSSASWSTRLVDQQLKQMRTWQRNFSDTHEVSRREALESSLSTWGQAQARKAFYRMLRLRKRWTSA